MMDTWLDVIGVAALGVAFQDLRAVLWVLSGRDSSHLLVILLSLFRSALPDSRAAERRAAALLSTQDDVDDAALLSHN
jgi:hypothetical protein